MAEHPIIFDADSVRGILGGRKRNTLRAVTAPDGSSPVDAEHYRLTFFDVIHGRAVFEGTSTQGEESLIVSSPYGGLEDDLWVKETFATVDDYSPAQRVLYREANRDEEEESRRWSSPIFMPRWASRLLLVIESLAVMRLQDITTEQIRAEGVDDGRTNPTMGKRHDTAMRMAFAARWNSINGQRKGGSLAWAHNPWVWSIGFDVLVDGRSEETTLDSPPSPPVIVLDKVRCEHCKRPIRAGDFYYEVPLPSNEMVKVHKVCLESTAKRTTEPA